MEYKEIVAVTGLSGLYQLLTTKSDGAIVRSVADKNTRFISARQHNVTPLESIEVYTTGDNVRLQEVFRKMQEHESKVTPADPKSADNDAIKKYFKSIFPEFDDERVYVSDMKKMLKWYELLKANDLLTFEEPEETASEEASAEVAPAPKKAAPKAAEAPAEEAAPVKKAARKAAEAPAAEEKPKKAASKTAKPAAEPAEEKPKKAASKKKAATPAAKDEEKPAKKAAKKK